MRAPITLFDKITQYSTLNKLIQPSDTIIIGLSGGPDSVFLLYYLTSLKEQYSLTLITAHLDHGWRQESLHDAQFCRELSARLSVPFVLGHARDFSDKISNTGSREDQGRRMRRLFFEQVAREYNAQKIALGHHQDDQLETFFIRLIRGASLAGLTGIRPRAGNYIRPLLNTPKQAILDYLQEHKIPYRTDVTNISDLYLRNRIRNSVLPELIKADPRFTKNCLKTIANLTHAEEFLERITLSTYNQITKQESTTIFLLLDQFRTLDPFLQRRIVVHWLLLSQVPFTLSTSLLEEIIRFLTSPRGGTHMLYQSWSLVKKYNRAHILKKSA